MINILSVINVVLTCKWDEMSLRPGLILIIQCLPLNNFSQFYIPRKVFSRISPRGRIIPGWRSLIYMNLLAHHSSGGNQATTDMLHGLLLSKWKMVLPKPVEKVEKRIPPTPRRTL
jgi:hypothetical protein